LGPRVPRETRRHEQHRREMRTRIANGCVSGVDEELIKAIRQDPGAYYVNIHSIVFAAGAIRGQLGK